MKGVKTVITVWMTALLLVLPCGTLLAATDVNDLEKRVRSLEDVMDQQSGIGEWAKRIRLNGLMEVEAFYEAADEDGDDTASSDIDLAKIDLGVDATITKNVLGHFIFQYDGADIVLDEGYVSISGGEKCPSYINVGYQVVPFGQFDSHFITDPITKDLGETKEGSLVVGYSIGQDFMEISAGVYNGKTEEAGDDDNLIEGYAVKITATPIEGLTAGIAYISSIADADGLADQVQNTNVNGDSAVEDYVGAWNAFVTFSMMDFRVIAEYISAVDEFEAGELYNGTDEERRPSAFNLELGYAITDAWEVAARYSASSDGDGEGGEFLPETQYGAIVNWGVFDNTNLGLEYLHVDTQEDYLTLDTVTVQLAVEF